MPGTMTDLRVRLALPDDRDTIAEFNCRLAEESEAKQLDIATVRAGVAALLADPGKGRYFVALRDNRLVGQLMHTWEWSDWRNGQIWWLQSVYIVPECRRQGVFRALCTHALAQAEADPGVVGVRLYVEQQNLRAHEVYRRLGLHQAGYFVMERMFRRDPATTPASQP
jgi:ribosomal protein S18 acetylase RimI-like enzyme